MTDVLIVGGGPAGLTAALYALRANKTVLVLEKSTFGGQMTFSPKIENYPAVPAASGNEIADRLLDQVMNQGAQIELEEVTEIVDNGDTKTVKTDCGEHTARAVIIATGAKHRLLHVPGEEDYIGNGISFCAVCDGAFYKGKHVAVVGGGNSALQEAMLLSEQCSKVTVLQNLDFLTGEGKLVEAVTKKENIEVILDTTVKAFVGDGELRGVVAHSEATGEDKEMRFDGVFVAIGLVPENKIVEAYTKLDKAGYIVSDETCVTDTAGLYTAGDCRTKRVRQVTTAVADGAVAALAACAYIDAQK